MSKFTLTIYGAQTRPNWPRTAHTFAIFSRVNVDGPVPSIESAHIISWLPADGAIPLLEKVPGKNYSIPETLAFVAKAEATIYALPSLWITETLFTSALQHVAELERGDILYVMIDSMELRPHEATNCIHAVSDVPISVAKFGLLDTGIHHGLAASRLVYDRLGNWVDNEATAQFGPAPEPIPGIQLATEEMIKSPN